MKTALHIIKTYYETGDIPTEMQFANTWDSFHHKDFGEVITKVTTNELGDITFSLSDTSEVTIKRFIPETSQPISYIDGLSDQLGQLVAEIAKKVDKENGKGLSEANFTQLEKDKLKDLQNYTPDDSKPISYIDGLQSFIDQITLAIDNKVTKVDGMGLSEANFTQIEKQKLQDLDVNLAVYNLSFKPAFLNYTYFGKRVFGAYFAIPTPGNANQTFQHNYNIDKYLLLEQRWDGLPETSNGEKAREDLGALIIQNTGTLERLPNTINTTGYAFPEGALVYAVYTVNDPITEGIGVDEIGTAIIGNDIN